MSCTSGILDGMPTTSGRLLALLSLLQARRDWPGDVLAARLQVSGRTVRRDVDRLRELGYPIAATMGPDGGYRLEAGSDLPPLLFDDDQAVALAVALQLATISGVGIEEAAARALTTVRQVMPARLRSRIDTMTVTPVGPTRAGQLPLDPAALQTLSAAIRSCETLRFDYLPAGADAMADHPAGTRRAQPHHLVARSGRWYVIAWDLDRDDWRTFRADRMALHSPNGPRFVPRELPGGDVAEYVVGQFRGGQPGGDWACRGSAVIEVAPGRLTPYLDDGTMQILDDDRALIQLGAWSWLALAASFARLDAELTSVRPAELRDAFGVLADRAHRAAG